MLTGQKLCILKLGYVMLLVENILAEIANLISKAKAAF